MVSFSSVVVFTTPERLDIFQSVFGQEADYRLDARGSVPFTGSLKNAAVAGGEMVVVDEKHFLNAQDMLAGIYEFTNGYYKPRTPFRIIVVCADRAPGDALLTHLAAFCGVLDIIYNASRADTVLRLKEIVERPNGRYDVRDLFSTQYLQSIQAAESEPAVETPASFRSLRVRPLEDGSFLIQCGPAADISA